MDSLPYLKTLQSMAISNMKIRKLTMTLENRKPSPRKRFLPTLLGFHFSGMSDGMSLRRGERERGSERDKGTHDLWRRQ